MYVCMCTVYQQLYGKIATKVSIHIAQRTLKKNKINIKQIYMFVCVNNKCDLESQV